MRLLLCSALVIAIVGPALAQTTPQPLVEIDDSVTIPGFEMTADTLDDLDVTDAGGVVIGEVEEVLGLSPDMPSALAIDFDDNQTDFGDEDRVVTLDQVELADGAIVLRMPPTGILELPVWDD